MKTGILLLSLSIGLLVLGAACGGSNSHFVSPTPTPTPAGTNVADVFVDGGTIFGGPVYANGIFTPVKICEPNTGNCTTLDDMLVDTGSYGIRVFSSEVAQLALPMEASSVGNALADCAPFVDSVMWGPVALADVTIGGEEARNIPIHVVVPANDTQFPIPASCNSRSTKVIGAPDLQNFPAQGILGIGNFIEDCGPACALDITPGSGNPGWYFDCPSSGCVEAKAELFEQVQNPVASFPTDNNGIILSLPTVPNHDAPQVAGSLIFGIGTQSNNGLGNATVFPLDNAANLVTVYNGTTQTAFVDSGSNALFFGTPTSSMPICTSDPNLNGFYCPTLGKSLSATIEGATVGSPSEPIQFNIANAETLFSNPTNFAFDNLGGPDNPPPGQPTVFDWGLPFFFGRSVYFSLDGQPNPANNGFFVAF